ncbi:MAG: hypothetical protein ACM3UU_12090 [Ignavibacteriales bacterium]
MEKKDYRIFNSLENFNVSIPDKCPFCHHGIEPIFVLGYEFERTFWRNWRLLFICPRKECHEMFFGIYYKNTTEIFDRSLPALRGCSPFKFEEEEFSDVIENISPNFATIYNQAKQAEERELNEICGLGYRKALEFLIKDYLITIYEDEAEQIKQNHKFSDVIKKYVKDEKIKFLAERATWLGNDYAHYTQKWEDKDIDDLKRLIKTSLYWISAEKELDFYKEEMPEGK